MAKTVIVSEYARNAARGLREHYAKWQGYSEIVRDNDPTIIEEIASPFAQPVPLEEWLSDLDNADDRYEQVKARYREVAIVLTMLKVNKFNGRFLRGQDAALLRATYAAEQWFLAALSRELRQSRKTPTAKDTKRKNRSWELLQAMDTEVNALRVAIDGANPELSALIDLIYALNEWLKAEEERTGSPVELSGQLSKRLSGAMRLIRRRAEEFSGVRTKEVNAAKLALDTTP